MEELVSIIMPTYNRGYIIKNAINSILEQTYSNIELIIVDDCSTDNTSEVIKEYDDNRLFYYKLEKNSGANAARNFGILKSKGSYITFQDSDDVSEKERIREQVKCLNENQVFWTFSSFKRINNKKCTIVPKSHIQTDDILNNLLYKNIVTTQCILGKREVFEDVMFDVELPRFQDWDLAIRLAKKYKCYHLDKVLNNVYLQSDSITKNPKKGEDALILISNKYSDIMNEGQKARIYCRIAIFQMLQDRDATTYFKKCLNMSFNIKYIIIYLLYKIKLLKTVYLVIKK